MAYISDVSVIKEGVDYYVGSYKAARKLSSAIKDVMGGVVRITTFSWKGQIPWKRSGPDMDIYKITEFKQGDFRKYKDHIGQVKGFDGRKILLKDFESSNIWSVMWKEYNRIKVIARSSDIKITSITSKTPKFIQV